jgi:hypothetical protein
MALGFRCALAVIVFVALAGQGDAQTITLQWDPSPSTDVVGYKVHVGTSPGVYTSSYTVTGTTFTFSPSPAVVYYFAVSAFNEGAESAKTPFVAKFTDHSITGVAVKAAHISELRTTINEARAANGLSAMVWTDPELVPGVTEVKAAHLLELRTAISGVYTRRSLPAPTFSPTVSAGALITTTHVGEIRTALNNLK